MTKHTWVFASVLASAMVACGPAPQAPAPGLGASTPPSNPPSSPTASTGASAEPNASSVASVAPSAQPSGAPARTVTLSGTVYDVGGTPVDGATVTITGLDSSRPFTATATTNRGSYVLRQVPEALAVEVVASRSGWTSRRRTAAFDASAFSPVMDFGGSSGADDAEGAAYFIARHPEIASITPAADSAEQPREVQSVTVKLSEPLDADNRKRFEEGLRLLPASGAAAPGRGVGLARDLSKEADGRNWLPASEWAYAIAKGQSFLGDSSTRTDVTWNAEGSEATFAWKAPLAVGKDEAAKYQVALVAGSSRIVDAEGLQLGTDKDGSQNAYPAEGNLIHHAFRQPSLALSGINPTAAKRWANTHALTLGFSLVRDAQAPRILSASEAQVGNDGRLELLFNEPLTVFDGTARGYSDASVIGEEVLSHLHFAVSRREAALNDLQLSGKAADATAWDPQVQGTWGSISEQERAFRIDPAAFSSRQAKDETGVGKLCVSTDPLNPARLRLHFIGRPKFFATEITHLRVRVEGIADPAGNRIEKSQADLEQPISKI